tara:strand:- start:164 stop:496 length:333 start_codon:yes stop_codon:yes gene_type:complete
MKKTRRQELQDIMNKWFFVQGLTAEGFPIERWCVVDEELNKTIELQEKKLNKTMRSPNVGDIVVHSIHNLGIGLVIEKHKTSSAYKVNWVNQPKLDLFIIESYLIPVEYK